MVISREFNSFFSAFLPVLNFEGIDFLGQLFATVPFKNHFQSL